MSWIKRIVKPKVSTIHIYELEFLRNVDSERIEIVNKVLAETAQKLKKIGVR